MSSARRIFNSSGPSAKPSLVANRKEQRIAIGVIDLDYVVAPPRIFAWNRPRGDLAAKGHDSVICQLNEQARPVIPI
jgi:hypothetical protein